MNVGTKLRRSLPPRKRWPLRKARKRVLRQNVLQWWQRALSTKEFLKRNGQC